MICHEIRYPLCCLSSLLFLPLFPFLRLEKRHKIYSLMFKEIHWMASSTASTSWSLIQRKWICSYSHAKTQFLMERRFMTRQYSIWNVLAWSSNVLRNSLQLLTTYDTPPCYSQQLLKLHSGNSGIQTRSQQSGAQSYQLHTLHSHRQHREFVCYWAYYETDCHGPPDR